MNTKRTDLLKEQTYKTIPLLPRLIIFLYALYHQQLAATPSLKSSSFKSQKVSPHILLRENSSITSSWTPSRVKYSLNSLQVNSLMSLTTLVIIQILRFKPRGPTPAHVCHSKYRTQLCQGSYICSMQGLAIMQLWPHLCTYFIKIEPVTVPTIT